jgi:hypothetical protein
LDYRDEVLAEPGCEGIASIARVGDGARLLKMSRLRPKNPLHAKSVALQKHAKR